MARKALRYGIQLVHQNAVYARETLWLTPYFSTPAGEQPHSNWVSKRYAARIFSTRAEAKAAQPAPWIVTTKVVQL